MAMTERNWVKKAIKERGGKGKENETSWICMSDIQPYKC